MIQASGRVARPVIKWAGGKQQLLSQLDAFFPVDFKRYFEPFVGSGAVFFHLWNAKRLPHQVFLFDHNEELINVYRVIRDHLAELIELLSDYKASHNKEFYYKIRDLDRHPAKMDEFERAARTIYLNRTCYNGLYRVNRKGQFNVPIGSYKDPQIVFNKALQTASEALQLVSLEVKDFRNVLDLARGGDFFYFDPPYHPLSSTASFTSYTAANFSERDQKDLADVFARLTEKGCYCMLSNSYTPFILKLYSNYRIEIVHARRAINSNATRRGVTQEVVVLNYNDKSHAIS